MSKKGGQAAVAAAASFVKLLVPAGKASAQPPVGPALGAKGVKAMDFAKEFNAKTAHLEVGIPTPAIVKINPDRTFSFEIKSESLHHMQGEVAKKRADRCLNLIVKTAPPTSLLLKRAAGIETGAGKAGSQVAGTITMKHIYEIAKIKMQDVKGVGEEQVSFALLPRFLSEDAVHRLTLILRLSLMRTLDVQGDCW